MPTAPYNPRRRDEEEDADVPSPTMADEIEVDFEPAPSSPVSVPQTLRGTGMRPTAPDAFAPGGIPDAPNLQTRRAVTKVQLGQPATQRDYRNIAQRQGIEQQSALQPGGEGMDAPDLTVRTAALKAQAGAPLSNREIDRLNTRQALEAQQGNLPPERSVSALLAGSRLDPRGTRAEQAAEARRLAAEQKQQARAQEIQARREFNSRAMAEYKKTGARYYTDPATGRLTPVVDEKGRQLYYRSDWEPGVDPQGRPAKVMRDEYGQRQFKRPTVVASPDAHDEFLYADMGDGESVPYMKIEEAVVHPDFSLQRTALVARRRRNETMHREALAPVKAMADQAQLEYDSAKEQIAQIQGQIETAMQQSAAIDESILKETEGGFLGIGAKPTGRAQQAQSQRDAIGARMQQLQAAQMQLEDDLKPGGRLARAKVMGTVGLKLATATAVRDAYRDQEQEILARLRFQGKDAEADPMFIDNRKRLQEAEAVIQGANKERQRYEQLFNAAAPTAAAPVPPAPAEGTSTLGGIVNVAERAGRQSLAAMDVLGASNRARKRDEYLAQAEKLEQQAANVVTLQPSWSAENQAAWAERARQSAAKLRERAGAMGESMGAQLAGATEQLQKASLLKAAEGYQKYSDAEKWDAVKAFLSNPVEVATNIAAEGALGSIPALVMGAAGAVTGGVPGMAGGTAIGSFATEYAGSLLESFEQAGVDLADPSALAAAFDNPNIMADAQKRGTARGIPVAVFDALSGGLAGRTIRGGVSQALKAGAREVGEQAALGAAGETAGQVSEQVAMTGEVGDLSLGDIAAEAIGELVPGSAQVAIGAATRRSRQTPGATPPTGAAPQPSTDVPPPKAPDAAAEVVQPGDENITVNADGSYTVRTASGKVTFSGQSAQQSAQDYAAKQAASIGGQAAPLSTATGRELEAGANPSTPEGGATRQEPRGAISVEQAQARLQTEAANDPELAALLAESEPVATAAPVAPAPIAEPAAEAPAGTPAPSAEVAPAVAEPAPAPVTDEPAQVPEPAPATEPPAPVAAAEPAVVAAEEEAAPPSPEPPVAVSTEITPEAEGAGGAPASPTQTVPNFATATSEEVDAWEKAAKQADADIEVQIFGPERAKEYRRLQRTANGSGPNADRAYERVQQMEDALSPEQQDILFGRKLPEGWVSPEDAKRLRDQAIEIDAARSGEELARASSRVIQGVISKRARTETVDGREAEMFMRVMRQAKELNVSPQQLVRLAFQYRASLEGADVFELAGVTPEQLRRFIGDDAQTEPEPAPAAIEAPAAERPAPTQAEDYARYQAIQREWADLRKRGVRPDQDEIRKLWAENEEIKNRYGGMPPEEPTQTVPPDQVNFNYTAWREGNADYATDEQVRRAAEIPKRPDTYREGSVSWGKDPARGRAIMASRAKKRDAANWEFFKSDVLPKIQSWITPATWKEIAQGAPNESEREAMYARGGWTRTEIAGKPFFTHPEATPKKHQVATAIRDRLPIAADGINPKALPEGYVLEGDTYVFREPTPPAPRENPPDTPVATEQSGSDPRAMSDEALAQENAKLDAVMAPIYQKLDALGDAAFVPGDKMARYTPAAQALSDALKAPGERKAAIETEIKRRDTDARNKASDEKRTKFIADAPVHQRRNGWEIIIEFPGRYVLRDPVTKEDIYAGSLKRVREVADESRPEGAPVAAPAELTPPAQMKRPALRAEASQDFDAEETKSGTTYQYRLAKEDGKWTAQIRIKGGRDQWESGVGVGRHSTRKAAAERFAARFPDAALTASDSEIRAIAEAAKAESDKKAAAEAKQKADAAETNRVAAEKSAAYMAEVRAVPLKGKSQEITLNRVEKDGKEVSVPAQAMVYGDWAIHKVTIGKSSFYSVTHVPSGKRAQQKDTLAQAKEMVQAFIHAGIDVSKADLGTDKATLKRLAEVAIAVNNKQTPPWFGKEGGAQPAVAPVEPPPTPAPSQMKAPALRAELRAAGVESVSGVPLDDANAAQLMAAVGKLRRGQLDAPATPTTDKLLQRLQETRKRKLDEQQGKVFDATEGLYRAAEIAALDIAILAVRAGRPIEQAIRMAVARFKARYPNATPDELTKAEASVRGALAEPPPAAPTEPESKKSLLPESLKERNAPVQSIEYEVRSQEERKREASEFVAKNGAAAAERALADEKIPGDTRVAIGGQLLNDRMLALKEAKPEDIPKITRDIQRITAAMQPKLATEAGQTIAMFNAIYGDVGVSAGLEYVREASARRLEKMGGEEAGKALDEATAILNDKELSDADKKKAIDKLRDRYTTKPVRRVLDQLQRIEVVKELNKLGALTRDDLVNVAGNALGMPGISQDKLKHIAELADKIKSAKTLAERTSAEIELSDMLTIYKGVSPMDLEASILTLNILSGYTTQLRNLGGNAMQAFANLATTALTNPTKVGALTRGLVEGLQLGGAQAKSILATGRGTRDFADKTGGSTNLLQTVDYARDFPGLNPTVGNILTKRARLAEKVGRFMKAADAVFYYPAREAYARMMATKLLEGEYKGAELAKKVSETLRIRPEDFAAARKQAEAEGFTGVDLGRRVSDIIEANRAETAIGAEAVKQSERFAAESTYTNEPVGLAGVIYRNLSRTVKESDVGGVPVLKPWAMFLKTPANVFNATTNWTPAGALRAARGMKGEKYRKGATGEGQWRNFTAEERSRLYLQSIIGTSIMGAMVANILADEDQEIDISASGPTDPNKRRQLQAAGWSPYSIRIGDKRISYKDSPLLVPLAIVGHVADAVRYQKTKSDLVLESKVLDAVASAPNVIFQTSMLSGLSDLMAAMSGKGGGPEAITRTLSSVPANLTIPYNRLFQQIDQTFDNQSYEVNPLVGSVPFARRTGDPMTDVQGRARTYSPLQAFGTVEGKDKVDTLLRDKGLFISEPSKDTKIGNRVMTEDEYRKYRQLSGQRIRVRLEAIVPRLRIMTKEAADKEIDRITREERERAKRAVIIGAPAKR